LTIINFTDFWDTTIEDYVSFIVRKVISDRREVRVTPLDPVILNKTTDRELP